MIALFVDLRTAFDSVDRAKLLEALREKGMRGGLLQRMGEIVSETRSRVRIGRQIGFWTARGMRQGCPLSSLLFNLLIADRGETGEGEMGWSEGGGG